LLAARRTDVETLRYEPTARPRRYPSDTTGGTGGWPVLYPRRNIVDAIRYLNHNSCLWQTLPARINRCRRAVAGRIVTGSA
jgi:hypothetical protein